MALSNYRLTAGTRYAPYSDMTPPASISSGSPYTSGGYRVNVSAGTATFSVDTDEHLDRAQSIKVQPGQASQTIDFDWYLDADMSAATMLHLNVKLNSNDWGAVDVWLTTGTGSSFTHGYRKSFRNNLENGMISWQTIQLHRDDWSNAGTPGGWDQIKGIRLRLTALAAVTPAYVEDCWYGITTKPKIIFQMDDGANTQATIAKAIFDSYGIKGGLNLISGPTRTGPLGSYLSLEQIQDFYDSGWDLAVHGDSTGITNWSVITQQDCEDEISACRDWFAAQVGTRGISEWCAHPGGAFDDESRAAIAAQGIRYARGTVNDWNFNSVALGIANRENLYAFLPDATPTLAEFEAQWDKAIKYGSTIFLCLHQFHATTDGASTLSVATLNSVLTAAKALHDAGTVDIVTPTQWIAGMSAAGALTAAAGPFGESSFQGGTGVLTDAAGPW